MFKGSVRGYCVMGWCGIHICIWYAVDETFNQSGGEEDQHRDRKGTAGYCQGGDSEDCNAEDQIQSQYEGYQVLLHFITPFCSK